MKEKSINAPIDGILLYIFLPTLYFRICVSIFGCLALCVHQNFIYVIAWPKSFFACEHVPKRHSPFSISEEQNKEFQNICTQQLRYQLFPQLHQRVDIFNILCYNNHEDRIQTWGLYWYKRDRQREGIRIRGESACVGLYGWGSHIVIGCS